MAITEKTFSVANISIRASADTVEKRMCALPGVRSASVSLKDMTMTVVFDDSLIDEARIIQEVRRCGYHAYTREIPAVSVEETKEIEIVDRNVKLALIMSFVPLVFLIPGFTPWLVLLPAVEVLVLCRDVIKGAVQEISDRRPSDSVMSLAAAVISLAYTCDLCLRAENTAAVFAMSGCVILCGALIRRRLVANEHQRSTSPVSLIRSSLPATASIYEGHKEKQTDISEIREDQILLVRPGETVSADGVVVRGFAVVNESALSGSDRPVEKSEGSRVYAGSVCRSGSLEVRIEQVGSHTAMMRFADLAEKTGTDSSFQSPFRSFGKYLIVYTALTALVCAFGWRFIGRSTDTAMMVLISVLASASLQAFGLSSSVSLIRTARKAAGEHILFRSVQALELVGKAENLFLEQDGTLTESALTVTDFIPAEEMSASRLEYIAYALCSKSEKPFARALTRYLKTRKISHVDAKEFSTLSTRGRSAVQSMRRCAAGTPEEMDEKGIATDAWTEIVNRLRSEGKRVMMIAENDTVIGLAAAKKDLIPGVSDSLKELQEKGCEIFLFTNGSEEEAQKLCEETGIENVLHLPSPEEKAQLFYHSNSPETVNVYIVSGKPDVSTDDIDILTVIGSGTDIDRREAGIQLTRNRLSDFIRAMDLSAALTEQIQKSQMRIILYHAFMILFCGFFFPAVFRAAFPAALCAVCSTAALYFLIKKL